MEPLAISFQPSALVYARGAFIIVFYAPLSASARDIFFSEFALPARSALNNILFLRTSLRLCVRHFFLETASFSLFFYHSSICVNSMTLFMPSCNPCKSV
jgi:hypothetical protein